MAKIYPEHLITWIISLMTMVAMLWGSARVIYSTGQWTQTITTQIIQLQQGQENLEKKLNVIEAKLVETVGETAR